MAIPQKKIVDNTMSCSVVVKRKKVKEETEKNERKVEDDAVTSKESSKLKRVKTNDDSEDSKGKEIKASTLSSLCDYGSDDEE